MKCLACQRDNTADARFCTGCGQVLAQACGSCGASNDADARFCKACGKSLALQTDPPTAGQGRSYTPVHLAEKILRSRSALEGERKQVTVLFADEAGFSALAERLDPEAVHEIMDGCFERLATAIHRFEGTINQFTGDGVMALFGAPIAHEDHAARALQAALVIQDEMKGYGEDVRLRWRVPFALRIGINTGTVVVGRIGDNLRMDYTAQGDTTNIAARLQQTAPIGTILAGEATYRAARDAFDWREVGPLALKGRETPVMAYQVTGARATGSRFDALAQRGLTRLVGRDAEFQQLLDAWNKARQGRGRVVSIMGEAGIGKSRLLYEFKRELEREATDAAWPPYLEGSCFAYGDAIPYLPFVAILKTLFGLAEHETEVQTKDKIAHTLERLGLGSSTHSPFVHNLLALTVEDDQFAKRTPEVVRVRTVEAIQALMLRRAAHLPLALIVDDVHWIDKATEEVVGALVEALADAPLLLVLVYRPEYLHTWWEQAYQADSSPVRLPQSSGAQMVRAILTRPYATRISLERLSPGHSRAMVQDLLREASLPPELEQLIAEKTDGNPLFVEELTRSLQEAGVLLHSDAGYRMVQGPDQPDLPTTVQGVLLARIDRLAAPLKELLQLAAVIGRVFSLPVLAEVSPPGTALEAMLAQLEDLEFVYPTRLAPQREYSFKHVLTQEAVYQTLLRAKREDYHERIGRALEHVHAERLEEYYELLARHFTRSTNREKALHYLTLANRKAMNASAPAEAKGYFDQAMAILDALPDTEATQRQRIALLADQIVVFQNLFKMPEYHALLTRFEPIARQLGDSALLGPFIQQIGHCEWAFGIYSAAREHFDLATGLLQANGNYAVMGQNCQISMWNDECLGEFDRALSVLGRLETAWEKGTSVRWYVYGLGAAATCHGYLGRFEEGIELGLKALRVTEEFQDNANMTFAAFCLAIPYTCQGNFDSAVRYGTLAFDRAPTPGEKAWARQVLGTALSRAGDMPKAIEILEPYVAMVREVKWRPGEQWTAALGDAYMRSGQYEKARRNLEQGLEIQTHHGMKFAIAVTERLLGELDAIENPEQRHGALAEPRFIRSIAALEELGAKPELALSLATYGRLCKRLGRVAEAHTHLRRALEICEQLGILVEPDKLRAELAE